MKLGERLRLLRYADCFATEDSCKALAEMLAEGQPPFTVSVLVLRQWYQQYHPASGPLVYETAAALEAARGQRDANPHRMANAIFLPVSGVVPFCEGLISRPSEKSRMRCLNKRGRESWDWAEQKSLYKKNSPHKVGEETFV